MSHPIKLILVALTLCLSNVLAGAQNPLGRMTGTVRDQTGAVIPNATVTVVNENTGQQAGTATTSADGVFNFPQLSPALYTVKIEMAGFKAASYTQAKVDPGQEYSFTATLEVGQANEVVQVSAGEDLVNTSTPEVSSTVSQRQIIDLPLPGRNPIDLIKLQAGVVGIPTRTTTTINGGRPTWTQVTQDGINIQDNFIRTNGLDFVPNRPTSDTIGEFTITTNTQGADAAGGSSQVKLITPSGTNEFHGSVFEFNRNSALGATSWFNNSTIDPRTGTTLPKPFLNRNQFGGRIGGPVLVPKKVFGPLGGWNDGQDKLFFFAYYEGFRQRTQATPNMTIPANDDFLRGVFRYVRPSDGSVQSVNVLQLAGLRIDPMVQQRILSSVPSAANVNNFDVGNSNTTRLLNTAGYRFNQSDQNNRNQWGFRVDLQANQNHRIEFTHTSFKETDDRTDIDLVNQRPLAFTQSTARLIVGAWRWSVSPSLQNEVRIGANLAPVDFLNNEDWGGLLFVTPLVTNPTVNFQPQGRDTRTRQFIDNASYVAGNHSFQFGGSLQQIRVKNYSNFTRFPTVNFGFSTSAPASVQLTAAQFPGGIAAADLGNANTLASFLAGTISFVDQTFQVTSKDSGFVPLAPNLRNYVLDNYAAYIQDSWRFRPNLTLRLGLKWEYFSPLREEDDLALLPVAGGRNVRDTLLDPNGTVDFVKGDFYKKDLNNFGPSVGFAWDPRGDGKMAIRGGYTLAFVNEETITVGNNAAVGNAGLESALRLANLYTTVSAGVPNPVPTYKVPRSYADQLAQNLTSAAFTVDPNIQQPWVHQISFSVERELGADLAVEGRYVGTLGRNIWQGVDLNQTSAGVNPAFLQDFQRARNNGFLALQASGVFNPAYNASLPGSQPLPVITSPTFGGGLLTAAVVRNAIQTGQVAELGSIYTTQAGAAVAQTARAFLLPNSGIYVADLVQSGAETDYHAFQGEVRRRFKNGVFGQFNYTFSKVLSNSSGTTQARFEPFIDNNRPQLEKSRADFDVTHVLHGSVIYELPFGIGKRFLSGGGIAEQIVGGWQVGSIVHWQSGAPISIRSPRGTFNRGGRSANQGANTTLSKEEIRDLFGIQKLPDGRVFFIDPKVTDPQTGRAVGPDNLNLSSPAFTGQVFFNPEPGQVGQLQRLQFDGPAQFVWNFSAIKRFRLGESTNIEFRAELFNFLNNPLFFVGDYDVNSTTFGRITQLNADPRVVQLALKFNF